MSNSSLLVKFSDSYADFHGWISLILCLFGIPFNIFIIIILRRTKIATFAINLILICIAICDSITMLVYVPYCIHFYIIHSNSYSSQASPSRDNYFWTIYLLINIFISITFHSLSIWLTVYLAFYRYFYIKESVSRITKKGSNVKSKNNKIIEFFLKKSKHAIFLIFIFCLLFCMPTYFFPTIKFNHVNSTNSSKESIIYYVDQSYLNIITNGFVFKASFYGQAVFAKILPCFLLVTFIYLLIHSLLIVKQNKKDLNFDKKKNNLDTKYEASMILKPLKKENRKLNAEIKSNNSAFLSPINNKEDRKESITLNLDDINLIENKQLNNRNPSIAIMTKPKINNSNNNNNDKVDTNTMLLIVCILFLITEFPQAILIFVSIFDSNFYNYVYKPLGDLMDVLVLINNSINFILYCTMSNEFRKVILNFFKKK